MFTTRRSGMVVSNGSIGAGEAFIHGYWSSPDLTAVVRVFVSNLDVLDGLEGGLARLGRPLIQGLHYISAILAKARRKTLKPIETSAMNSSSS